MKTLSVFVMAAALIILGCTVEKPKPPNNCSLGINFNQDRGKIKEAVKARIDSLDNHIEKEKKKQASFDTWMCDNLRRELVKLQTDLNELPEPSEAQMGFDYVEGTLKKTIQDYGVDYYIDVSESFCRGQHIRLVATFSSADNETYLEKRLVQYNKKRFYEAESGVFETTYVGHKHVDVCPDDIFLVYCLREKQPANPVDLSRLKSLYPDEKIVVEGVFDGFRKKAIPADLGGGLTRPEVECAFLKNWTILSPTSN